MEGRLPLPPVVGPPGCLAVDGDDRRLQQGLGHELLDPAPVAGYEPMGFELGEVPAEGVVEGSPIRQGEEGPPAGPPWCFPTGRCAARNRPR